MTRRPIQRLRQRLTSRRATPRPARPAAAALAAALAASAGAAGAQLYRVYEWDTPMQGFAEPALWNSWVARSNLDYSHFGRSVSERGVTANTAELEYGVTDRFTLAGYVDYQSAPGMRLRHTATRLEGRYRFGTRYSRIVDPAVYVEYSVPNAGYERAQELEVRFILQRDVEDFRLVLNPIVGRSFRDQSESSGGGSSGGESTGERGGGSEMVGTERAGNRLVGGLAAGLYWRRFFLIQPGVEYYNQVGALGEMLPVREQRHLIVPTVDLRFIPGMRWNVGVAFGRTPASDKVTLKSVLSYEFQTIRPANRAP